MESITSTNDWKDAEASCSNFQSQMRASSRTPSTEGSTVAGHPPPPPPPPPPPSPRHPAGKHRPPNRGLTAKLSRSDFAPLLLVPASNFESMVSSSADIIGDEITIDTRLSHFELAPWVVAAWHSSAGAYTEQSQSSTTNHIKMRDENRYQKWNKNKTKKMSQKKATKKRKPTHMHSLSLIPSEFVSICRK